jgi:cytochrome P450 family 142 subfamily A polypeptide 1
MSEIDFDIFNAQQSQNMWELARKLRSESPVARIRNGFVYVARYEDCRAVFRDQDTYSNAGGLRPTGIVIPLEDSSIGELVAPIHPPVRKLATVASQGGNVAKRAQPFARRTADELLDRIVRNRKAELMSEFSLPLTNRVIAWLLGVPIEDAEKLSSWGEEIMLSTLTVTNETERGIGYKQAFPEFTHYLESLIEARMGGEGPEDTVSRIVRAGLEGADLTVPIIRMVLMNLVLGGTATTRDLMGNLLLEVLTHPELHEQLRAERERVPAAVEESLRLSPPVLYMIRTCIKPTQLGGLDIEIGTRVVIGIASANRDEEIYPDSETFLADRKKPAGHLSFGLGQHFCVGAPLARIEAVELLNAFLDRFAPGEIRLTPDFELEWMPMPYMLGPKRLEIEIP